MILLENPATLLGNASADACCAEISKEYEEHSVAKTSARLKADETTLHARIKAYFSNRGNPELLGPSPFQRSQSDSTTDATVGDLLFNRYRSGSRTDAEIVGHAERVATGYCPYCCLWMRRKPHGKSPDRDHILPRSVYPEFSLLRVNLVVSCDDCNDEKLAKVFDSRGLWMFIHPYYDDFLAKQLISATVSVANNTPVVTYEIRNDVPADVRERVKTHFRELDLASRYADEPLRTVVRLIEAHRDHVNKGADISDVREILRADGEKILTQRPNDPTGHALLALADSDDLAQLLGTHSSPPAPATLPVSPSHAGPASPLLPAQAPPSRPPASPPDSP